MRNLFVLIVFAVTAIGFGGCKKDAAKKSYIVKYYVNYNDAPSASVEYKDAEGNMVKTFVMTDFEVSFTAESGFVAEMNVKGGGYSLNVGTPQAPRFIPMVNSVYGEINIQGKTVASKTSTEFTLTHTLD